MKKITLITALLMLSLTACDKKPSEPFVPDPVTPATGALPAGHPPINNNQVNGMPGAAEVLQSQEGTVVSSIDIPQFTYLEVRQNDQTRWIAASTVAAKKGDVIKFDSGTTMTNFNSKTLNRTFSSITFVNRVTVVTGK